MKRVRNFLLGVLITGVATMPAAAPAAPNELLNVSYDPTRELYQEINGAFAKSWGRCHDPPESWRIGQAGACGH